MIRQSIVPGVALAVLGCAPAVSVHVPPRPNRSEDSPDCAQAGKLRDQAMQYRREGRALRARLFEARAHDLCGSLPTPAPEGDPQGAHQRLEEVWSWVARTGPRQALSPNRLPDAKVAAVLDAAVLGLTLGKQRPLVVEPVFADIGPAGTPMTGWLHTSDTGFGKVGEWFERYFVPKLDNIVREKPIGPFADRIIVYLRKGYGDADVAIITDVVAGGEIAQIALPGGGGPQLSPVRLDDMHFALPVQSNSPSCANVDDMPENCAASGESVDVWQAWPPKRVARFLAPAPKDINRGERIVTMHLPNQGNGPPKEKKRPNDHLYGGYVPTRVSAERLREHDSAARDETPRLSKLVDLGNGILAVDWTSSLSLIDWHSLSVLAALPHVSLGLTSDVVSASGRFVAYTAAPDAVGLFDRKTGSNRVLMAPGFGWLSGRPAFSPDERWLATGGSYAFGYLWNTATGRLERTLPSPVPFVRIMEDEGMVDVEKFIRSGNEVVFSTALGGTMARYEVPSGRYLPWPELANDCQDTFAPTRMLERSDGSVAFLDSKTKAFELGPAGVTAANECMREMATIEAVAENGEAYLQRITRETGGRPSLMRWISSRDGKVLGQWPADILESFEISHDGRFAIGNAGPVISLTDFRELWPRRCFDGWPGAPIVTNTAVEFDSGAVLDVERAALTFRAAPARPAAPVSQQRQDELQRIESQQRAEAGDYVAEYDHGKVTLSKGAHELASHPGSASRVALREDGSEVLLVMGDGLHLWQPRTGKERTLRIEELTGYHVIWTAFGPGAELLVFGIQPDDWGQRTEMFVLLAVDETTGKTLFKRGQSAKIQKPSFGSIGSQKVLRALIGDDLVAWDVKTGKELERWKHVDAYASLANGTLLAFLGPGQVELARVQPPERLATVQMLGPRPNALVTSPDGRLELLGDRQADAVHLRCRVGHIVLPFSACTESGEWEGLLRERLSLPRKG